MTVTKVGNKWQARFRHDLIQYKRVFSTEREALNWERSIRGEIRPEIAKGTLREHLREFLNWGERIRGKAPSTTKTLNQMLTGNFLPFMESIGVRHTAKITIEHIRKYDDWWMEHAPFNSRTKPTNRNIRGMRATWNMYWQAVHAFCEWSIKRGYMSHQPAPAEELRKAVKRKPPDTFERDEIEKILAYLDTETVKGVPYKATMIRLLLFTGLRLSEALQLKWADVDLKARTIKVVESRKSDESRTIPVASVLLPYLKALPHTKQTVMVFDDGTGKPIHHKKTFWADLQRACMATGVRRRRVHDLRHTCARYLIESGTDLVLVQKILGHKDIRTTFRYAQHFDLGRASKALNAAFPDDNTN